MKPDDLVLAKLQKLEKTIPSFHRMTLRELSQHTGISEEQWSIYLQREDVRQRIHAKTSEDIEIAHRVALAQLAKQAQNGNIQAIKELNQLSGILNQNNNKQIVTHYVKRPEPQQQQQQKEKHQHDTNNDNDNNNDLS